MAPVAGMLAERGFRVTGSDVGVYPPASTLLRLARHHVERRLPRGESEAGARSCRDRQRDFARQSRARAHPRRKDSVLLDAADSRGIFHSGAYFDRRRGDARQNHHHRDARLDFSDGRPAPRFSDRRSRAEFRRPQLRTGRRGRVHHRRRRVRHGISSTRRRNSCTTIRTS